MNYADDFLILASVVIFCALPIVFARLFPITTKVWSVRLECAMHGNLSAKCPKCGMSRVRVKPLYGECENEQCGKLHIFYSASCECGANYAPADSWEEAAAKVDLKWLIHVESEEL